MAASSSLWYRVVTLISGVTSGHHHHHPPQYLCSGFVPLPITRSGPTTPVCGVLTLKSPRRKELAPKAAPWGNPPELYGTAPFLLPATTAGGRTPHRKKAVMVFQGVRVDATEDLARTTESLEEFLDGYDVVPDDDDIGVLASLIEMDMSGDRDDDDPLESIPVGKIVSASATVDLPFSAEVAFDAFSDLTRQPSWSPWLRSVVYLDDDTGTKRTGRGGNGKGKETEWTLRVKGLKLSWTALSTKIDRPYEIGWASTSGVKNAGRVVFEEINSDGTENNRCCRMTLTMSFVAPRALAVLFRRTPLLLEKVFRDKMLMGTLTRFADVVFEEDVVSA